MGPGTVERLPLRRPRAVPERCGLPPMHAFVNHFSAHRSDLVDKSVHERKCGTGSRKERDGDAARGGRFPVEDRHEAGFLAPMARRRAHAG